MTLASGPNTSALTPDPFIPTSRDVLVLYSSFGMGGHSGTTAFLYHPVIPGAGLAVNSRGSLAPVLEHRWREFELAAAGAQKVIRSGWGGWWSKPQNVIFELGPAESVEMLDPMRITGHTVSKRRRWSEPQPDNVKWWMGDGFKVMDKVPVPFLEVESIVSDLSKELFPWDYTPYSLDDFYFGIAVEPRPEPLPENVRSMVMALRNMSATGRRQTNSSHLIQA
ncbi:hypothetical protein C8J57DRAFT_1344708 [Mycena rebaudengoi]|nr:hypothetical protein C8J57DRAFT_1344708 [Mycena rebaudengoi]